MNKKLSLTITIVFLATLALSGSAAMAIAPLGTPTSDLKAGQFGLGVDYAYDSTKVKIDSVTDRLKTNTVLANLGFGVTDDLKGFLRFGIGDGKMDEFNGDYKFAWGFGAKYTFLKQDKLDWGALFQMNWLRSEDTIAGDTVKLRPYDITVAVGPNYEICENVSIYGGPLLQWIRGSISSAGEAGGIREKSMFGGYIGSQVALCPNTALYGEYQYTFNGWGIGTGITWKF